MRARRSSGAAGLDIGSVRPVRPVKSHAGDGARAGAPLAWRFVTGGGIGDTLIICYHGISDSWPSPSAIPVERLERQLCHLLERGYRGTTFSEAVLSRPRGKTVAVTFDDAYRSIGEHALPLLSRLGLPATLFVPTHWVGRDAPMAWKGIDRYVGGAHETELLPLSWAEITLTLGRRLGDRLAHALTPGPDDALRRRAGRRAGGVAGGSSRNGWAGPAARSPTRTAFSMRASSGRPSERATAPVPRSPSASVADGRSSGREWGSTPTIRTPAFERRPRPGAGGSSARGSAKRLLRAPPVPRTGAGSSRADARA